jgi:membrane-associated phospholipid phosphatase
MQTTGRVKRRLTKPKAADLPPVWTKKTIALTAIGIAISVMVFPVDGTIAAYVRSSPNVFFQFLREVNNAMQSEWYLVPAFLIVLFLGTMDWSKTDFQVRRHLVSAYGSAAFIFVSIAGSGILVNLSKQVVGRGRPRTMDEMGSFILKPFQFEHTFQGYPSGHSTVAGSIAMISCIWYPKWRWPLMAGCFALAFGRVPAGSHYLSDVIAGFTFGAAFVLVLARWLANRRAVFGVSPGEEIPHLLR